MTVIVDYDAGNLRSVQRACAQVGVRAEITTDPERVRAADRVIFPGVGAAGSAAEHPDGSAEPWACPLPLGGASDSAPGSAIERLRSEAEAEIARLMPWYEHAVAERERTTVGACGLPVGELLPFVVGFLEADLPESPRPELSPPLALKAAYEDLKQMYLEAASAQPTPAGEAAPSHAQRNDWFWRETRVAELLRTVAREIGRRNDPPMKMVSTYLLLPHARPE